MKKVFVFLLLYVGSISSTFAAFDEVKLLSRSKYDNYEKACYSFYHMTHDSDITHNNYEIQYGNGGNTFHVNMVTDDLSFIADLGNKSCDDIKNIEQGMGALSAARIDIRDFTAQNKVEVVKGHCYVSINNDSDTSIITLFRVKDVVENDNVTLDQIHILKKL